MYGLLLEAIMDNISRTYGEAAWDEIRRRAGVRNTCFSTHETYSEQTIPRIAAAASEVTGVPENDIMDGFGVAFVNFVSQYGYGNMLKVLGRHMRDFLNGLDNLHEYLRFSYPKLRPPSFFVENENKGGLTLRYRSRRKGYVHYVKGQIRQVGEVFYNTKVVIHVINEGTDPVDNSIDVTFRLLFDNIGFKDTYKTEYDSIIDKIPLRSELLFELFPFHVVFGKQLQIRSVGSALSAVIPDAVGRQLPEVFYLARPITQLTWEMVMAHTNNVFELVSRQMVKKDVKESDVKTESEAQKGATASSRDERSRHNSANDSDREENEYRRDTCKSKEFDDDSDRLHVKGQMMFMSEWDSIMFLGTPIMKSLDDMFNSGLYINDLSMHDSSRDLVLAGTQQSAELKLALDQEQEKSRLLEESMKKLDSEMKRTDALLYQMIPKPVADRLRRGEPSVNTCQVFESVTILFSDVVGFTTICSRITPMEVVSMLNAMYTEFDKLSETHDVYKVETIGDAYMAVAGAPTVSRFHALCMCNMALDMLVAVGNLKDPSKHDSMKIRVGIHTGTTVAGVVGIKMPRYCLFGDTVNTASRMETNGEKMKIHISETTRRELLDYPYVVQFRGEIAVKGKGSMKTYWLLGRDENPADPPKCPFQQLIEQERREKSLNRVSSSVNVNSPRPVYSPVSFDDLHVDTPPFPGTPSLQSAHHSPTHSLGVEGAGVGGTGDCRALRRGSSPATYHNHSLSLDTTVLSPPGSGLGAAVHQTVTTSAATTSTTSSSTTMSKPMRAVPPQLTATPATPNTPVTPLKPLGSFTLASTDGPQTEVTSTVTSARTPLGTSRDEHHHQNHDHTTTTTTTTTSGLPNHNSNNSSVNAIMRNNDKVSPPATVREEMIPTKDLDSGKGPVSGQRKPLTRQSNHIIKYTSPRVSPHDDVTPATDKSKSKTCSLL